MKLVVIVCATLMASVAFGFEQVDPEVVRQLVIRGQEKRDAGDLTGAIADFTRALELGGENWDVYQYRANTRVKAGSFDAAISDLERAIALLRRPEAYAHPNYFAGVYTDLGSARVAKGDLSGGIAEFDRAIEHNAEWTYAYSARANAKYRLGDMDGAIRDYTAVIALRPRAGAFGGRADAKLGQGDFAGAIADFAEAVKQNPKYAYAISTLGFCRFAEGDYGGALADLSQAVTVKSDYASAYTCRGCVHLAQGELAEAMADFDQAIESTARTDHGTAAYPRFYRYITLSRLHRTNPDSDLRAHVGQWSGWERDVGDFLTGGLSEEAFLARAEVGEAKIVQEHRCEASYYVGIMRLQGAHPETAKTYFEQCVATRRFAFWEFALARAELRRAGDPR